ncbi:Duplicated homeodomain-like superfamily protein isoform 2 [Hibiscus syriacus]|uniref:Duplicated homeodomain-like superfamily protein isoform 2 n=1 Tax=Hibiscus syriacus TaxID=106335 RepID=A0A6A3B6V6_HIBSY|nr:Duplicated homeodomain-like superfamily protein isoform 2 [Hibiscus syriacus]
MPALILDEKEKKVSRFISSNGLVEDPFTIEKERALINPWTSEEKEIFIDKLAAFGKDFRKIASFLDHKTTADCVELYYKNHNSECFEKTKNKNDLSKQGKSAVNTYLLTSGKKRSRENAATLDVLGAASVIAAHAESSIQNRHKSSGRITLGGGVYSKSSQVDDSIAIRSSNFDIVGSDEDTVAADVLAGICGSFSSEAMNSCITSSAGPGESYHHDRKCHKVDSVVKRPSPSDVLQNVDEDTCSNESGGKWILLIGLARKCLGLDLMHQRTRNTDTPMSDDANGGGTDTEEACALESTVICGDKLGSNVEDNLPPSIVSMNVDELDPSMEANQTGPISEVGADDMDEHDTKCSIETGSQIVCRPDSIETRDESIDRNFNTKGLHKVRLDLGSAWKPSILLLPNESSFAKISALHDSDTSQCENICNQDRLSSTLASPETEDKQAHKAVSGYEPEQFAGKPLVDLADLQISTLKEINVDVGCKIRDRSHFQSLSDTEKPCSDGNVKLFGQILKSSSLDEKVAPFLKPGAEYSDYGIKTLLLHLKMFPIEVMVSGMATGYKLGCHLCQTLLF